MTKNLKKIFAAGLLVLVFGVLSQPVFAQNTAAPKTVEQRCKDFKKGFTIGPNDSENIVGTRPVFCSASELILAVLKYAFIISGSIAILFIIVGGFWYLTSAGSEEQAEKGKKTLVNSAIGLAVIIMSYAIVRIISNLLTSVNG